MTHLIRINVTDPDLRDWVLPKFTTTTDNDLSIASIVMMASTQNYFRTMVRGGCGFPLVTVEGERSDWEEILTRVRKLPKYGEATEEWSVLLIPIVKNIINSFENPSSQEVRDFWLHACRAAGRNDSSETETLSGWLSAFCFWDEQGRRVPNISADLLKYGGDLSDRSGLVLNNVTHPVIDTLKVPSGIVSVPVTIQDLDAGQIHKTTIVAGSMSMKSSNQGCSVQPLSGWFLLQNSVESGPMRKSSGHCGSLHSKK